MPEESTNGEASAGPSLTNYAAYVQENSNQPRIGHLDLNSGTITPLAYLSGTPVRNLYEVIEAGEAAFIQNGEAFPRSRVKLLPPIYGRDILAVGKNYAVSTFWAFSKSVTESLQAHAKEFNASG